MGFALSRETESFLRAPGLINREKRAFFFEDVTYLGEGSVITDRNNATGPLAWPQVHLFTLLTVPHGRQHSGFLNT